MAASLAALIGEIKRDIRRDGEKIAKGVATIASQDLKIAHQEIMASYYAGYTPCSLYYYFYERNGRLFQGQAHGYRRTGNLENSLSPKGVIGGGLSYSAQVNVDAGNMSDYTNTSHPPRTFPGSAVLDMVWNQGIRGLPPGNIGHVGEVDISAAPVGVYISGIPDSAMSQFVNEWGDYRGGIVADMVAFSI